MRKLRILLLVSLAFAFGCDKTLTIGKPKVPDDKTLTIGKPKAPDPEFPVRKESIIFAPGWKYRVPPEEYVYKLEEYLIELSYQVDSLKYIINNLEN